MAYGDTALTTQPAGYVQDALNKPFAFSNTQAALNPGQLQQQAADTAYQSATRYLDPQFQRQQSGLESQLANQGITRGSEAWNNSMNQFGENKNQAYDQARSQAYTQGLSGANQALNTMFQQGTLDTSRQNALTAADAMKTGGLYGMGGAFLGSPSGQSAVNGILGGLFGSGGGSGLAGSSDYLKSIGLDGSSSSGGGLLSGLGGKLSGLGSSAINGLGGLFGSGGSTYGMDAGTADLVGLGGDSSMAGFDPTGGYLTAAMAADKLMGGKLGIGNTVNDLVGGASNAVSDLGSSIGDVFGW
jgi:hypothetical protein